jgi:DNA polymerase-1
MTKYPTEKKRLVLLDSHAIIHRGYHALPDLTSEKGEPTGALYGLSSMLMKIIVDLKPDYMIACYDLPKPTIRHEAFEGYKGTREKSDEALVLQIKRSRDVFAAFAIPTIEREGFEADDLLGTLAQLAKQHDDVEVVIASGDHDTLQLVDGKKVQVYTLKKGLNDTILYDEQAVIERYGFKPEFLPDYKGLRGDPSDNIKGVKGIGEKTATTLIKTFGTLENMYRALKKDESAFKLPGITPRIIGLLKDQEEDAMFSKMLALIRLDAPIAFHPSEKLYRDTVSYKKVQELFDELSFRSLRSRLQEVFYMEDEGDEEFREEKEEVPLTQAQQQLLKESSIMLWLLNSEFTNASIDDVFAYTKSSSIEAAHEILHKEIKDTGRLSFVFDAIERPLIPVLDAMREHGVLIDTEILSTLSTAYHKEVKEIEKRIHELAGKEFNVSSPKQLATVLFDDLAIGSGKKKTATGQRTTKESELEKMKDDHPIIPLVLEYRELTKLLSTYVDSIPLALDDQHRLHAQFLQSGTTTGRMSSQNPNLQNIPIRSQRGKAIRNAIIAPKGYVLCALDYSQIELRLAAILSKDEKLSHMFASGNDVHTEVAAAMYKKEAKDITQNERRNAKAINFGMLYGMGVNALRQSIGGTLQEAHEFYESYFTTFVTLGQYLETVKGLARKNGYTETLFGRRRQFPEMKSPLPYVRAQAERMAINAPLQGTQSDIIKRAMVLVDAALKEQGLDDVRVVLQIHDELVYEIPEGKEQETVSLIKSIMEGVLTSQESNGVAIKVDAKIGKNWGEMVPAV